MLQLFHTMKKWRLITISEDVQDSINSSQLFYNNNVKVDNSIRKVADNYPSGDSQHVQSEALALKNISKL